MSVGIAGLGWVTPLGADLEEVWRRLQSGEVPEPRALVNAETGREIPFYPVPPSALAHLERHPRLRRSSAISHLAVAAGLAAFDHAGRVEDARTAVVFAVCDGGVLYTRRFYEQIVKQGAPAASPLLFPETVYNAPASHLAALLGINGASYTLVGDAAVGLAALHFAAELLETSDVEQVIVVGAEECDWIICEGYRLWRLARTPLAEGAAAVVLRREGKWRLSTHPGAAFTRRAHASVALEQVLAHFAASGSADLVVRSANGTFIDRAEASALAAHFPGTPELLPKRSFGEAPGASALCQTVAAALALQAHPGRALVSVIGFNQQTGAALLEHR